MGEAGSSSKKDFVATVRAKSSHPFGPQKLQQQAFKPARQLTFGQLGLKNIRLGFYLQSLSHGRGGIPFFALHADDMNLTCCHQ